jgi:SlyX protein
MAVEPDRLIELESRIAFQEDAIERLSTAVAEQQAHISRLREELQRLARQVRSMAHSPLGAAPGEEPPPPHY